MVAHVLPRCDMSVVTVVACCFVGGTVVVCCLLVRRRPLQTNFHTCLLLLLVAFPVQKCDGARGAVLQTVGVPFGLVPGLVVTGAVVALGGQ